MGRSTLSPEDQAKVGENKKATKRLARRIKDFEGSKSIPGSGLELHRPGSMKK